MGFRVGLTAGSMGVSLVKGVKWGFNELVWVTVGVNTGSSQGVCGCSRVFAPFCELVQIL